MKLTKKITTTLNESGLSRIMQHIKDHETGAITAYRDEYSKKENQQRNKKLLAQLRNLGYSVTKIQGTYIENFKQPNAKEVKENSFFVVDIKDKNNIEKDLKALGAEYDQDSILVVPKGGKGAYLLGTNSTGYPGFNKKEKTGDRDLGSPDQFMSKIGGRPFNFMKVGESFSMPNGVHGKWACKLIAEKDWSEIEL